jgi:uncharacterized protein YecE (DUF72 family)
MNSKLIKTGCCGFPVAREKYYKYFNCIEINSTFYQLPDLETAEKWRKESPQEFEFIIKAWQLITHEPSSPTYRRLLKKISDNKKKNYGYFKPTDEVFEAWEQTELFANVLYCNKIVFQCPSKFIPTKENINNMIRFFKTIKKKNKKLYFIWEPRGNKWTSDEIKTLCSELNLIHCVDPTVNRSVYGDFNYYRLHGKYSDGKIDYNYKFNLQELKNILKCCSKKQNYVMFNNMTMFDDALLFKKIGGLYATKNIDY